MQKQIHDLSTFTMVVLCDRAQRRGLQNVDYIVRQGDFFQELRLVLSETQPNILVIGQPIGNIPHANSLEPDKLTSFFDDVEKNLKISVVPVEIEITD